MTDLVLKGARAIDPSQGIDRIMDVAFAGGRVEALGENLPGPAREVGGLILTPGLIDVHTHVYWGGTSLGIDADNYGAQSAVTTCIDTGSAGPGNYPGFLRHVIEPSQTRILAYLNISFAGIYGFSGSVSVGEAQDMRLMAVRETAQVARDNRDTIIGIKVRIGKHAGGTSGTAPLDLALDAADRAGLPLMCHIDEAPPTYSEALDRLRPGDVLTHAFRPFPNAPVLADGTIRDSVHRARQRGVIFDIGHGMGSFSFATARAMLAQGFTPDTISSDVHALCLHGPAWDLLRTMTKFLALGLSLPQVIQATTQAPAAALRRPDLGTLRPGAVGDASLIALADLPTTLEDVTGETFLHPTRLVPRGRVMAGQWHD